METPLCQVALSVSNLALSEAWYQVLGLEPSGGMPPIAGELPARILELPEVDLRVHWLRGRDPMSQLEVMQYLTPIPRGLPADFGPHYQGYGILSLVVPDFESILERLTATPRWYAITGTPSRRSLWVTDPDGILLEILERDPLGAPDVRVEDATLTAIRAVSLTVPDLGRAQQFWISAVGLTRCSPEDTPFNPFPGRFEVRPHGWEQVLLKGGNLIVRLLKPRDGVALRRPAYRICDVGVLNVAAIVDSSDAFRTLIKRVRERGYRFTTEEAMEMGDAAAVYGHDDQGTSIEMGYVLPGLEAKYGWRR